MGSAVWFSVTHRAGYASLLSRKGTVPFASIMGPHILLYKWHCPHSATFLVHFGLALCDLHPVTWVVYSPQLVLPA